MPAYEQAAAALEAEIRSGRLGADERLLSERALAERLRVSRITIRRALARLAEKDLVRSSERSGWFTVPVSHGSTAMISFTDQGRQRGFAVTSRVLRCGTREATLEEAEELGVAPGSQVCDLARIRFFDGLPDRDDRDDRARGPGTRARPARLQRRVAVRRAAHRIPGVSEPAASSPSRPGRRRRRSATTWRSAPATRC